MKLTGKMVLQRSKEKMIKGFEERMKRHCNEMQTVKPHKELVEEDDKDFKDQLAKLKSCNPIRKLYENGFIASNSSI